jgi:hypothetical protein
MDPQTFLFQQRPCNIYLAAARAKISSQRIAIPAARSYGARKARIDGSLTENTNRRTLHQYIAAAHIGHGSPLA